MKALLIVCAAFSLIIAVVYVKWHIHCNKVKARQYNFNRSMSL
jgi:hypothetical protein